MPRCTRPHGPRRRQDDRRRRLAFVAMSISIAATAFPQHADAQPFDSCDVDGYYSSMPLDLSEWTKEAVGDLLASTHRRKLTFTNPQRPGEDDDTWAALLDLDLGRDDPNDTVHLLYADKDVPAIPFGQDTWQREHIWPAERFGQGDTPHALAKVEKTMAFADVMNLRPATALNRLVREDRYFGVCGALVPEDSCTAPASGGGAPDTCECSDRLYQPPANVRGDVARVLLYMDARYDGRDGEPDLQITDCPVNRERNQMAYLSQLLQWHLDDPVDDAERRRNDRACSLWQGNRNPFVDFEALPELLYGRPEPEPAAGRLTYERCDEIPTFAPTFSPNLCESFRAGDVYFFLVNSDDPDAVALVSLEDLPAGMELFLTDDAWNGEAFQETEGVIKMTVPDGGISAGTTFGYGPTVPFGDAWESVRGAFSLSTDGEQVFLYCTAASGDPYALAAISYNGPFAEVGEDGTSPSNVRVFTDTESALPPHLRDSPFGAVVLEHMDNYVYQGDAGGDGVSKDELRASIVNASNWMGSDDQRFRLGGAEPQGSGASRVLRLMAVAMASATAIVFVL